MALKLNAELKNGIINKIISDLAGTYGTAGTACIRFYSGTQPATADSSPSGTVLCTISPISWSQCVAGTTGLTGQFVGTANQAGTVGWARLETIGAGGTFRIDGGAGSSSTQVFVVNNPVFATAGGAITLLTTWLSMA